jgi:hypothetical protein
VSTHESYAMADRPADEPSRGEAASDHVAVTNADPLLDRVQLAVYLGISERQARTLMEQRRVEVVSIGRSVRVRQSTADRLIDACTMPAARPVQTDSLGRETWLRVLA